MAELVKDKRETSENLNKYYRVGMKMDENTKIVQSMVNNKYLLVCHRIKWNRR